MTHPLALIKRQRYVSPSIDTIISTSTYGGDVIGYYTSGTTTYAVHMFNRSGTFTLPSLANTNTVEVLLVGGGGSGGASKFGGGGGGGGGGYVVTSSYQLTAGVPVTIEIGAGATAAASNNAFARGNNGSPSTIGTGTSRYVVALGGGGGGSPGQVPYLSSYSTATLSGLSGGQGGGAAGTNLNATYSGYFNASGTYLTFTSSNFNVSATDSVWTIECWVYIVSNNTYFFCIGSGSNFGNAMACGFNGSSYFVFYQGNGTSNPVSLTSSVTYSLNTWYHYAVSRTSGGVITLFVNGVQQATQTYNTAITGAGTTVVVNGLYDNNGIGNNGGQFYISNLRFVKGIAVYNYTPANTVPTAVLTTTTSTALLLKTPNYSPLAFVDSSVNNLAVTSSLASATTSSVINPFLSSLYFGTSGSTNYIRINPAPQFGTNNFTIEGWFYFYGGNTALGRILWYMGVISGSGTYQGKMYLSTDATNLTFGYVSSLGGSAVTYAMTNLSSRWNHIAVVKAGAGTNQTTIYINGNAAVTTTLGDITYSASNFVFDIGNNPESGTWYNQFLLSNFRIVNGIAVYTSNFTLPTAPFNTTQLANVNGNPSAVISSGTYTTFLLNGPGTVDTSKNSTYSVVGSITYPALSEPFTTSSYVLYCPGNSYVTTTVSRALGAGGGNYTIEMWLWVGGLTSNTSYDWWLFGPTANDANVAPYLQILINHTGAAFSATFGWINPGGGQSASASTTSFLYKWAHLAYTRSGTTGYLWVDGVNIASSTQSTSPPTAGVLFVGGYSNAGRNIPSEMYIKDFRVTSGVAVYTSTFIPTTSPLTTTQLANVNGNPSAAISTASWISWLVSPTGQTITDSSTYGLSITSVGSYVQLAKSANDLSTSTNYGSLLFNGNGYLTLANPTQLAFGTNNFSMEAWIYPINWAGGTNSVTFLFDFRPNGVNGVYPSLYFNASGVPLYYVSGGVRITGNALSLNTWHHIVVARLGRSTGMIVNGSLVGTVYDDTNTYLIGSGRPFIGGDSGFGPGSSIFRGLISNVRMVNGSPLPYNLPLFSAPTKFLETTQAANVSGYPSSAITTSTSTILLTLQRYGENRWDVPNESPYSYSMSYIGTSTSYGFMNRPYYGSPGNLNPFTSYDNLISGAGGTSIQPSLVYTSLGPSTLEYIVVAGGGGGGGGQNGGFGAGGGGGAGGVVSGTLTLRVNDGISVTVGAGGTGAGSFTYGSNGVNSTLTAPSTTFTAYGGGGGGYGDTTGLSGGSGGGPSGSANQGSSTTFGYGNNGGSSQASNGYGGAGGGAGSAGVNFDAATNSGTGGAGKLYSNFGLWGTDASNSTVPSSGKGYFGGGGAAGNWYIQGTDVGGVGGGGNGQSGAVGLPGQPYTGGGGGGGAGQAGGAGGGNGGSGIVIVRYISTYSSGIVTGNPTVTTSSGYTYYAFTSTGAISWPSTSTTSFSGGTAALGSWASGGGGGGGAGGTGGTGGVDAVNGGSYGGIGARYERTGAYYAGGGSGAAYNGTGYTGGFGGGADGWAGTESYEPYNGPVGITGQPNTGGGGSSKSMSGAGGSGVVIVSYQLPSNIRYNNRVDPYFKYNTLLLSTIDNAVTYDFPAAAGTITATDSRQFSPPPWVEVFIVAGGGAGGKTIGTAATGGGGGGGGGVVLSTATISGTGASTTIVVGAGGAAPTAGTSPGNGSNSSAWGFTAIGGGAGGNGNNASYTANGQGGGCGGGGAGTNTAVNASYSNLSYGTGGSGQVETQDYQFQGFGGGVGGLSGTSTTVPARGRGAGGGGGAGEAGGAGGALTTATTTNNGSGNGGAGLLCPWSLYNSYYAGGGGGGRSNNNVTPTGGGGVSAGGGGNGGGGAGGTTGAGTAGVNNFGGGGGGAGAVSTAQMGGKGGTGTVIVRYLQIYSTATVTGCTGINIDRGYRYYKWDLPGSFSMSFPSQLTTLTNAANALYLDSSINNSSITSSSQNIGGSPYQGTFTPYSNAWSELFVERDNVGRGMNFSTGTQFVYGNNPVTIEAWLFPIYMDNRSPHIFRQPDNLSWTASQINIQLVNWTPYFTVAWGGSTILTCTIPVTYSAWQHFAFVREGTGTNQAKVYLNGILAGVGTAAYNYTTILEAPTISSHQYPWEGYISNFRIVNGTALYIGGTTTGTTYFSPPTTPLSRIDGTSLLSCADHLYEDKSVYNNKLTTTTLYAAYTATSNASVYFANLSKFSPFEKYGNNGEYTIKSRIGGSAYFPGMIGGEASHLIVNGASSSTLSLTYQPNFTVETWFYCTHMTPNSQTIISYSGRSGTSYTGYGIGINGTAYYGSTTATVFASLGSADSSGGGTNYGNYVVSANRWYHVAFVQIGGAGGNVYFYVNGTLNATAVTREARGLATTLWIGYEDQQPFNTHFTGYLCDLRITRRAVYTGNFNPPILPLTRDADTMLLLNFTNYKIIDYTGNTTVIPRGTMSTANVVKNNNSSMRFNGYDHMQFLSPKEYTRYTSGLYNVRSQFTVECWIYITAYNSGQDSSGFWNVIYSDSDNGSDGIAWFFGFAEDGRPAWYYAGDNVHKMSYVLPLNAWFHLAWVSAYSSTLSNSYVSTYVNGQLQPIYQTTSTSYVIGQATLEFRPNMGMDRGRGFWSGYVEDLRVTQGIARYTGNFIPPAGPLPKG